MADGGLAPCRRRAPRRDPRPAGAEPGRVHPDAQLARRGRARLRRPVRRRESRPAGLQRRRQRVHGRPPRPVRPCIRGRRRQDGAGQSADGLPPRALVAPRHPDLRQGPGLEPRRQHGHRDLPDARGPATRRPGPDRRAVPGLPGGPARDRLARPDGRGGSRRDGRDPPRDGRDHRSGLRLGLGRVGRPGAPRRRHRRVSWPRPGARDGRLGRDRLEQLGGRRQLHRERQAHPRQRPAPRVQHALHLVHQRAALPAASRPRARTTSSASPSPAPRA